MNLAIRGGKPIRTRHFPAYKPIGAEEKIAVNRVLDSGVLSKFLGCWDPDFFGGPEVQALEREWATHFGVKHAITVNSNTSGLYCAIGAAGVEPGDEVIVSPYSMAASATAPLIFNAVPVFADIEDEFYCLDVRSVEEKITSRTKAILVVDIFGLPYDVEGINALAKKHGLIVIEDAAQAPGALYRGKHAGTLGDMGIFSLNYHKHIHCGEGGVIVTDDDRLADRLRLIRNHAEAVVEAKGTVELDNMIGFNFRMTEIEASIARCQLKKLDGLLKARQENCAYLAEQLSGIPALTLPAIRDQSTHAYYIHPIRFSKEIAGVARNRFVEAVRAELPPTELRESEGTLISSGYVKPLYLQPMFQKQIAYGTRGCPFKAPWYEGEVNYAKGLCPVTERLYEHELIEHELMRPPMTRQDLDDVAKGFWKVWENRNEL